MHGLPSRPVGAIGAWWAARRVRHRTVAGVVPDVNHGQLADLEVRLAAVEAGHAHERDALLAARLGPLIERRTPARVVEAVPGLARARVRFADGTAVLVQGVVPGDVGVLASWVRVCSVVPSACTTEGGGTRLELIAPARGSRLCVRVEGLDQPE